jgi:hypothetical protein
MKARADIQYLRGAIDRIQQLAAADLESEGTDARLRECQRRLWEIQGMTVIMAERAHAALLDVVLE